MAITTDSSPDTSIQPMTGSGYAISAKDNTIIDPIEPVNAGLILHKDAPKYIPIQDIIHYIEKGLSYNDIGIIVGCSASNVCQRLQSAGYTLQGSENYKKKRDEILTHVGSKLVNVLNDNISSVSVSNTKDLLNLALAHSKIYGDERLERGLSTEIVDFEGISKEYLEAKKLLDAYEERERATIDVTPMTTDAPGTSDIPASDDAPVDLPEPLEPVEDSERVKRPRKPRKRKTLAKQLKSPKPIETIET